MDRQSFPDENKSKLNFILPDSYTSSVSVASIIGQTRIIKNNEVAFGFIYIRKMLLTRWRYSREDITKTSKIEIFTGAKVYRRWLRSRFIASACKIWTVK